MDNYSSNRPGDALSASQSYIIFASDLEGEGVELALKNSNIGYKSCIGAYKGEKEDSWMVNAEHFKPQSDLNYLLKNQESVLVVGPWQGGSRGKRSATLHYLNGSLPVALGALEPASKEEALEQDNWTLDIENNQYWVTTR